MNYVNTEVEPQVAVDPTNPNIIVGAFQQDRWNDGGAKGLAAARSTNGGASQTRNWAAFSACSEVCRSICVRPTRGSASGPTDACTRSR